MTVTILNEDMLNQAKAAFTLRRAPKDAMKTLIQADVTPRVGDVVLARVKKLNQHKNLQLINGRRSRMFQDDLILVAYGNRYAPDQFEALVPSTLGPCDLVAGGGIASEVRCKSGKVRPATKLEAIGLVGDKQGNIINLADYALPALPWMTPHVPIIAIAGTAMNAGKTETVINLAKGLTKANLRIAVLKVTGTGAGGDIWAAVDAGSELVLDFTDAGLPSTYHAPHEQVENAAMNLISHALQADVDAIVIELADGLYQQETSALLSSPRFSSVLNGLIFAAGDAMGAVGGVDWLKGNKLPVLGVSGLLTQSPLAMMEANNVLFMPIFDMKTLNDPVAATALIKPTARLANKAS